MELPSGGGSFTVENGKLKQKEGTDQPALQPRNKPAESPAGEEASKPDRNSAEAASKKTPKPGKGA